ncbi:MAG: tetratricopeptide repeat protein [Elusimicrobiota bacterium]
MLLVPTDCLAQTDFETHLSNGDRLATNASFREALKEFEAAHALRPDDEDLLLKLARTQSQLGDHEKAIEGYSRCLQTCKDPAHREQSYTASGRAYEILGQPQRVIDLMKQALLEFPESLLARFYIANAYARSGDWPEANRYFVLAVESCERWSAAVISSSQSARGVCGREVLIREWCNACLRNQGQPSGAEDRVPEPCKSSCSQRSPVDEFDVHYKKAKDLLARDLIEEALQEFKAAQYLRPDEAKLHLHLARCYRRLKDFDQALAEYRRCMDDCPESGEKYDSFREMAATHEGLSQPRQAIAVWEEVLRSFPGRLIPHREMGRLFAFSSLADWPQADEHFRLAVDVAEEAGADSSALQTELNLWMNACEKLRPRSRDCEMIRQKVSTPGKPSPYPQVDFQAKVQELERMLASRNYDPFWMRICYPLQTLIRAKHAAKDYRAVLDIYDRLQRESCVWDRDGGSSDITSSLIDSFLESGRWQEGFAFMAQRSDPLFVNLKDGYLLTQVFLPKVRDFLSSPRQGSMGGRDERLRAPSRWLLRIEADRVEDYSGVSRTTQSKSEAVHLVGRHNDGPAIGLDWVYRVLVHFDLKGFPRDAILQDAFLFLDEGVVQDTVCHRVLEPWDRRVQRELRSEGRSIPSSHAAGGGSFSPGKAPFRVAGPGLFDVTLSARRWLEDPGSNFGLLIKEFDEGNRWPRWPTRVSSHPKLLLVLASETAPVMAEAETVRFEETWQSLYSLGMRNLAEKEPLAALSHWTEARRLFDAEPERPGKAYVSGKLGEHVAALQDCIQRKHAKP